MEISTLEEVVGLEANQIASLTVPAVLNACHLERSELHHNDKASVVECTKNQLVKQEYETKASSNISDSVCCLHK